MPAKRSLAVGLIGYNFMGKAHSNAWRQTPRFFDVPTPIRLKTICGRNRAEVKKAARKTWLGKFRHRLATRNQRSQDRHHRYLHA